MSRNVAVAFLFLFLMRPLSVWAGDTVTILRVIDGNHILLLNGETVKLLGVDVPEVEIDSKAELNVAEKAKIFLEHRLKRVRNIHLEYDEANARIGHRDKQGRRLAYVHVEAVPYSHIGGYQLSPNLEIESRSNSSGHKGKYVFLNASLVKLGYSAVDQERDFKLKDQFLGYQQVAIKNQKGMWQELSSVMAMGHAVKQVREKQAPMIQVMK